MKNIILGLACGFPLVLATTVVADDQRIAPGRGNQALVVADTGPNGLCETTAVDDDFQFAPLGFASPNLPAIACDGGGGNDLVDTTATGDDVQLVAVGGDCTNGQVIIDTGADGIANTTAAGDDVQTQAVGTSPVNAPCVGVGPDGVADTVVSGGDDVLAVAGAGATVVRCGPNGRADTTANNANPAGDDVQALAVGAPCMPNDAVVTVGPNLVADTRAEGPDLVLKVGRRIKVNIPEGKFNFTKQVKLDISNFEFGATAPATRTFKLEVDENTCPGGTVSQVDADGKTDGLQATAVVAKDGKLKASFLVTFDLNQIDTVSKRIPKRCFIDVTAIVVDPTVAPFAYDATNPDDDRGTDDNNRTQIAVEIFDKNDL